MEEVEKEKETRKNKEVGKETRSKKRIGRDERQRDETWRKCVGRGGGERKHNEDVRKERKG